MVTMYPLLTGFAVALVLTPLLRWFSHRHELLDHPNDRSSHVRPTPRNGGIAIVAGVVVALVVFGQWRDMRLGGVLAWAAAIAALGLFDDLWTLSAKVKFVVQVAAAVATIFVADVTLRLVELPFVGDLRFPYWIGVALTLLWIVGLTNGFNFMDGVNGIAAIEAVVCASAFTLLFLEQGDRAGAMLSLSIAGGAAGFLVFNARGSIFMGDVGSGTLGFLFAVLALRLTYWDVPFFATLLPLLPFLFDTSVTLARRAVRRERLFEAHRTHYYQRLTDLGWSHMAVSATYGLVAAACSAIAVNWKSFTPTALAASVVVLIAVLSTCAVVIDWKCRQA